MDNQYITKSDQKTIIGLGFRLDTLRQLAKKAKNSSDKKEIKDTIYTVSDTLNMLIGKHLGINENNDIIFVEPIDTKKIAKAVSRKVNQKDEEKHKTR